MKTTSTPLYGLTIALLTSAALLPHAEAITITTDSFTDFDMDFAEVGDTTNVDDAGPDGTVHGAVSYEYRMGVNEVSEAMIDAYNTANPSIFITKNARGADKPATSVSWNEAARFVNWLNTSQGHSLRITSRQVEPMTTSHSGAVRMHGNSVERTSIGTRMPITSCQVKTSGIRRLFMTATAWFITTTPRDRISATSQQQ